MGPSFLLALLSALPLGADCAWPAAYGAQETPQDAGLPAKDRELQSAIGRVMQVGVSLSPEALRAELDRLEQLAGDDFGRLVPQLFLFSRQAKSTREAMAFGVIVSSLRIPDASVLRALVPFLELPDKALRSQLAGYLAEYEDADAGRRPSFAHYRDFLAGPLGTGDRPPAGLLRYLYERDAGQAVLLLMSICRASASERREILWAEHRLADVLWQEEYGFREKGKRDAEASDELNRMALHATWYARYFAVELLAAAPHLGQRAQLERLGEDQDLRVRAAALRALGGG